MTPIERSHLRALARIARREAGLHLPDAKAAFLAARMQRRLRATGTESMEHYLALASRTDAAGRIERRRLVSALTTNVTFPFREPHHFEILGRWLASEEIHRRNEDRPLRIWSAGCSTGEEPLSIAATCRRVLGARWRRRVRILATDVDDQAIRTAGARRNGDELLSTMAESLRDVVPACTDLHAIGSDLQGAIHYVVHNLLTSPPEGPPFDVIFCRNVTIYFDTSSATEAHNALSGRLAPRGFLFLGHSERLLAPASGLESIGRTAYRMTR